MKENEVVGIIRDWRPCFVLVPRRTINKKWIWLKRAYCRDVWVYTGFTDEPERQWAELFDILRGV